MTRLPQATLVKSNWPTPWSEQLDALFAKPLTEVKVADFIRVIDIARDLLKEKKKAHADRKGRAPDRVLIRDAVGNEFPFQLSRIGWKVGDILPVKFELRMTDDPKTKRLYRLCRTDDWNGRMVYQEIV